MRPCRLVSIILLAVLAGCGTSAKGILAGATKVEVYRIDGGSSDREPPRVGPGETAVDGFAVTARGKDQGPEFAARLDRVLSDEQSHSNAFAKCFWPGVVFRVYKGEERVDVVICYTCQNFYLGPPKTDGQVQENTSFRDTPAVPKLVRLAKEALPDDPDIQALKE